MNGYRDQFETFEHCGLTFAAYTTHDDSMGAPWKEHDGHGDVREIRADSCTGYAKKRPGERAFAFEFNRSGYAYDWQGAMKKARAEGWGLPEGLAVDNPTPGKIADLAVMCDFQRLRAWANDEWHWVGVIVELQDTDGNGTGEEESLWGIESDCPDYHAEVARELAEQLIDRLGLENKRRKKLKRETAARSESIRVLA